MKKNVTPKISLKKRSLTKKIKRSISQILSFLLIFQLFTPALIYAKSNEQEVKNQKEIQEKLEKQEQEIDQDGEDQAKDKEDKQEQKDENDDSKEQEDREKRDPESNDQKDPKESDSLKQEEERDKQEQEKDKTKQKDQSGSKENSPKTDEQKIDDSKQKEASKANEGLDEQKKQNKEKFTQPQKEVLPKQDIQKVKDKNSLKEETQTNKDDKTGDFEEEKTRKEEESDEEKDNEKLWVANKDGSVTTKNPVSIDVKYEYKNSGFSIEFSRIEEPGKITIKEHKAHKDLGALDAKAWEVTSTMENGTFKYDLALPYPKKLSEKAQDLKVVYSSKELKKEELEPVKNEKKVKKNKQIIEIKDLDHFTFFMVTDDDADLTRSADWVLQSNRGFNSDNVHYPSFSDSGETATWNFNSITDGSYRVFISWTTNDNRTKNAPYTLNYQGGSYPFDVNQEDMADGSASPADGTWSGWYEVPGGPYNLDTASNLVLTTVANSGSDYVIADEVLLVSIDDTVNLGYNIESLSPGTPGDTPVDVDCGGSTNENSVAQNWTAVSGTDIFYQREVTWPDGTVSDNFYETNNYTNYGSFGSGVEGVWSTRVRAIEDINGNGTYEPTEDMVSSWSNACEITYDVTDPSVSISAPGDGETISSAYTITGDADDSLSGIDKVRIRFRKQSDSSLVETLWAVYDDSAKTWELDINPGDIPNDEYRIVAMAFDKAGNTKAAVKNNVTVTIPPNTPTLYGWNLQSQSASPNQNNPGGPFDLDCSAGTAYTNDDPLASNWSDEGANYLRANQRPDGSYIILDGSNVISVSDPYDQTEFDSASSGFSSSYNNNYTGWGSFGIGEGSYMTMVRAFYDSNGNGYYDAGLDPISDWSNNCTVVYDTTAPANVTVDTLSTNDPTPSITGGVDDPDANLEVTVNGNTYTAANNGDGTWTLADDTIAPDLASGIYDVSVVATDLAGNSAGDSTVDELTVDLDYPSMTNINMYVNTVDTDTAMAGDTVEITADVVDPNGIDKVQIWIRHNPWDGREITWGEMTHVSGDTYSFTFTLPATYKDGSDLDTAIDGNYYNFRPYDSAGNSHIGWKQTFTAVLDTTPPSTDLALDPTHAWDYDPIFRNTGDLNFTGTAEDIDSNIDSVEYRYSSDGGATWSSWNTADPTDGAWDSGLEDFNFSVTGLADDEYIFEARSTDEYGNVEADPYSDDVTVNVDTVVPVVDFGSNSPDDGDIVSGAIDLEGQYNGTNAIDERMHGIYISDPYAVGGSPSNWCLMRHVNVDAGTYSCSFDTTSLSDGEYTVMLVGRDKAQNSTYGVTRNIIIDNTPPTITWNDPTDSQTINGTQTLSAVCDGGVTESQYVNFWWWNPATQTVNDAKNNGQYHYVRRNDPSTGTVSGNDFSWDLDTTSLNDGDWTLRAACKDEAGNYDHKEIGVTIDNTPPAVTVNSQITVDTTPKITGTIDDPNASIEITVNGNTYPAVNNGDGTWTLADDTISPDLAVDVYDVEASAVDAAGNIGTDSTTDELKVISPATPSVSPTPSPSPSPEFAPDSMPSVVSYDLAIELGHGYYYVDDRDVLLEIYPPEGFEPVQMIISENEDFSGAQWQPYQSQYWWYLDGDRDDRKVVYVKLKDAYGRQTDVAINHIVLVEEGDDRAQNDDDDDDDDDDGGTTTITINPGYSGSSSDYSYSDSSTASGEGASDASGSDQEGQSDSSDRQEEGGDQDNEEEQDQEDDQDDQDDSDIEEKYGSTGGQDDQEEPEDQNQKSLLGSIFWPDSTAGKVFSFLIIAAALGGLILLAKRRKDEGEI